MKKLVILSCLLGCEVLIQAQTAIPTTGGNSHGGGGTVSYSVGQVAYTTISSDNSSFAQGVQQPYEISLIKGIDQTESITLVCSAYPNPVSDNLTLKLENYDKGDLSYKLFDVNGKFLDSKRITGNEITITMTKLLPSTYFLEVIDRRKVIKTFKIIKY